MVRRGIRRYSRLFQEAARFRVRAEQGPDAIFQFDVSRTGFHEPLFPSVGDDPAYEFNKNLFGRERLGSHGKHHASWLHNVMRRLERIRPEIEKSFFECEGLALVFNLAP